MTAARRLALAVLFLSAAWTTVPRLAEEVRRAFDLRALSHLERRTEMFRPFYEQFLHIDAFLPRGEPVGVILDTFPDAGPALFFAYYAFPRPAHFYHGLPQYRSDPAAPQRLVAMSRQTGELRLMTYAEIRAERIGAKHVVSRLEPGPEEVRALVIPLVSSGDGPPPDVYTTEAVVVNRGAQAAYVRVRMFPAGHEAAFVLEAGELRTWTDFVHQLFGTMETGWLRIESDQPLGARFWFVNRGRNDAEVLEPASWFRKARLDVPPGGRMWVLNPHDRRLPVRLNQGRHRLPPRSVIPLVWVGEALVESDDDWFAFVSWRDAGGDTRFIWPERR